MPWGQQRYVPHALPCTGSQALPLQLHTGRTIVQGGAVYHCAQHQCIPLLLTLNDYREGPLLLNLFRFGKSPSLLLLNALFVRLVLQTPQSKQDKHLLHG